MHELPPNKWFKTRFAGVRLNLFVSLAISVVNIALLRRTSLYILRQTLQPVEIAESRKWKEFGTVSSTFEQNAVTFERSKASR